MKILHLIEKGSTLKQTPDGDLETFMWLLDSDEQATDYVALHKQKSQRSWKGGRILSMREATEQETAEMADGTPKNKGRMVVRFEPVRAYNGRPGIPWGGSRRGTMAYKSLEEVDGDGSDLLTS